LKKSIAMLVVFLFCFCLLSSKSVVVFASSSSEIWIQTYGGNKTHFYTETFVQTYDGGFMIAGATEFGPLLLKTDAYGNMEWNQTYEGTFHDYADSLIETSDKGYALISRGQKLFKFDLNGNLEWNRTLVGGYEAKSLIQTSDGGYAVTGFSGDPLKDETDYFWLVKTDEHGYNVWNKTYRTVVSGTATSVIQTIDGGYAMVGSMRGDFGLVKTDSSGELEWSKKYEKTDVDFGTFIFQTNDGGYMLAGTLWNRSLTGHGGLIKTDSNGTLLWMKNYPGGYSMVTAATSDGGYILCSELSLTKTDSEGKTLWSKDLYLPESSYASERSVVQALDGGYAVLGGGGFHASEDNPNGIVNAWIIKTDPVGNVPEFPSWTPLLIALVVVVAVAVVYRRKLKQRKEEQ
jgi:hypothetical protein